MDSSSDTNMNSTRAAISISELNRAIKTKNSTQNVTFLDSSENSFKTKNELDIWHVSGLEIYKGPSAEDEFIYFQGNLYFENCAFPETSIYMTGNGSININNCQLHHTIVYESTLESLIVSDSKISQELLINFSKIQTNVIIQSNSTPEQYKLKLLNSSAHFVLLENLIGISSLSLGNCEIQDFDFGNSKISELYISNSSIREIDFDNIQLDVISLYAITTKSVISNYCSLKDSLFIDKCHFSIFEFSNSVFGVVQIHQTTVIHSFEISAPDTVCDSILFHTCFFGTILINTVQLGKLQFTETKVDQVIQISDVTGLREISLNSSDLNKLILSKLTSEKINFNLANNVRSLHLYDIHSNSLKIKGSQFTIIIIANFIGTLTLSDISCSSALLDKCETKLFKFHGAIEGRYKVSNCKNLQVLFDQVKLFDNSSIDISNGAIHTLKMNNSNLVGNLFLGFQRGRISTESRDLHIQHSSLLQSTILGLKCSEFDSIVLVDNGFSRLKILNSAFYLNPSKYKIVSPNLGRHLQNYYSTFMQLSESYKDQGRLIEASALHISAMECKSKFYYYQFKESDIWKNKISNLINWLILRLHYYSGKHGHSLVQTIKFTFGINLILFIAIDVHEFIRTYESNTYNNYPAQLFEHLFSHFPRFISILNPAHDITNLYSNIGGWGVVWDTLAILVTYLGIFQALQNYNIIGSSK